MRCKYRSSRLSDTSSDQFPVAIIGSECKYIFLSWCQTTHFDLISKCRYLPRSTNKESDVTNNPKKGYGRCLVIIISTVQPRIEIEFSLVCLWQTSEDPAHVQLINPAHVQLINPAHVQLINPAHVQLIWPTSVRRCWSARVEQTTCLPPSRAIYRIIQNQTKNSSFSNILRIIYSGHCALNNVKRFRIWLVFSYRCSKKTVVLYCVVTSLRNNSYITWYKHYMVSTAYNSNVLEQWLNFIII